MTSSCLSLPLYKVGIIRPQDGRRGMDGVFSMCQPEAKMLSTLCVLIHVILAILGSRYLLPILQMKVLSLREDKAMLKVVQVVRGEMEFLIWV